MRIALALTILMVMPGVRHAAGRLWTSVFGEQPKKHPPENFGFILENGYGERIDTFEGLLTKDMVSGPDTTIAFHFSESDLDAIYRKVIKTRFFDLPGPHPPYSGFRVVPHTTYRFVVQAGDKRKELSWSTEQLDHQNPTPEWKRLWELMDEVYRLRDTYPEYKALPTPRSAYL